MDNIDRKEVSSLVAELKEAKKSLEQEYRWKEERREAIQFFFFLILLVGLGGLASYLSKVFPFLYPLPFTLLIFPFFYWAFGDGRDAVYIRTNSSEVEAIKRAAEVIDNRYIAQKVEKIIMERKTIPGKVYADLLDMVLGSLVAKQKIIKRSENKKVAGTSPQSKEEKSVR